MMWQSSMLISLLVLSIKQIEVPILVNHDFMYRGPITPLEPLVVLVGNHQYNMLSKKIQMRKEEVEDHVRIHLEFLKKTKNKKRKF